MGTYRANKRPGRHSGPDTSFVPLTDYSDSVQAQLAKLALDEAGIACRVNDTDVLQNTLGRVTLYVAADHQDEAREVLGLESGKEKAARRRPAVDSGAARVRRAFRTSLAAFLLLPGVLHLYSLWMLLGVSFPALDASSRTVYKRTVAIDALALVPAGWFIASIYYG